MKQQKEALSVIGTWLGELSPRDTDTLAHSVLPPPRLAEFATRVGAGPCGWAVELGAAMAVHITEEIPELAVDGIAQELRRGCEAVALGLVAALSDQRDFNVADVPEVLLGTAEVVSRGVGIEHMLRAINVGHSFAVHEVLDACERLLSGDERFTAMRRVCELMLRVVDELTADMARDFGQVQQAWLASAAAARMEIVQSILHGDPVPPDRAARVLGYDLTRQHLAVVAWADDPTPVWSGRLEEAAVDLLRAAGCTSTLVVPVGDRRVWAWGSGVRRSPGLPANGTPRPSPGIRIAAGLTAPSLGGFRDSHHQALEAARVGMMSHDPSSGGRWLFDYGELDLVAMLSYRIDLAREFVRRELGGLAGPGESTATVRATLKCYLDEERSLNGAAEHLHVARNTVAYRVQRAEQLRGREIGVRRMQLQAALTLVEELGEAVLYLDPAPSSGSQDRASRPAR
ncbi:helix-turn-helix domain-containing protein [Streptomyces sp. NPDC005562]|uniref:PucR family transcriptional regulator n=1 Tax=Streptomyces sp. NPDC005562 TaxID=3154890 RepID=UPI0033B23325